EQSGMATVFKAFDRQTCKVVALKVLHNEVGINLRSSSRFAREGAITAKLAHPGILKIISVAEKSRPYAVMEYLGGENLCDLLERTGPLQVREALQLASRVCEILEYIHKHGVIHCDLKPGNIIIADDGRPHLIDFGIAKGPESFMLGSFSSKV